MADWRARAPPPAARATVAGLAALTLLELLWESWLAPMPGIRWLVLKALPLAILFPGVARGGRKPRQWLALLLPWYFAEAIARAITEPSRYAMVAALAAVLAAFTFLSSLQWFRGERRSG